MLDQINRSFKQQRLEDLAGHRCLFDTGPTQVTDLRTHAPHPKNFIAVANVRQNRVRVTLNRSAMNFIPLRRKCLSNVDREVAPTSD